jgi:hypothetical protein
MKLTNLPFSASSLIVALGCPFFFLNVFVAHGQSWREERTSLPALIKEVVQIKGVPISPVQSAVVDFSALARKDALRSTTTAPLQGVPTPLNLLPEPSYGQRDRPNAGSLPLEPAKLLTPSPDTTRTFPGLDDIPIMGTGTIVIPPDVDGAVGLSKVLVGLNNNYRILDKASGTALSTVSISTFWSASGGTDFFDPKTLYDPFNNRWIVVVLSDANTANSSIEIGVSQTSDPGGSYYIFRVKADQGNSSWADFPTVGFNKNWVAVNVNLFTLSSQAPAGSEMLVADYAQLRGGTLVSSFIPGTGFCSSPAATYSATEDTLYVPTHLGSGSGTYRLDKITGTPSSPIYAIGSTLSRGTTWTQASGNILPQKAPLSGASACGTTPCPIEPQDAQIRSTPVVRGGFLYYAQTVGLPAGGLTHTAVQWTKLDASGGAGTGSVVDGGRVEDPSATSTNGGGWYAYPHIAVNQFGDIIFGFSQFSSTQYPSAAYTVHLHGDAAGSMRDPYVYKAGEDYYHKTFTTTSGRNRWGDYSKAQVDPSDDTGLWVLNEYAKARVGTDDGNASSNSSRWGTWWAYVGPSLLPIQLGAFSGRGIPDGGVQLEWTTLSEVNNFGFYVQRQGSSETGFTGLIQGFVPGHGTTLAQHHYSFVDTTASRGAWNYRLKQVDLDGTTHYSGPIHVGLATGLMDATLPRSFAVSQNFPNPFNPTTVVSYQLPVFSLVKLVVFDILGREVSVLVNEPKAPGSYTLQFDASGMATGVYFYQLRAHQIGGGQAGTFVETRKLSLIR